MSIAEADAPPITPDEFVRLPDSERYELIDGELVERNEMGVEAAYVGSEVATELKLYARVSGGFGFGDGTPFAAFGRSGVDVLKPDAAYVAAGRLDALPEGVCYLAPDLVVEVVSPSDRLYGVEDKTRDYLDHGVHAVWVVSPPSRQVREIRLDSDRTFREGQTLVCEDVLPGFAAEVAKLFPAVPVVRPAEDHSDGGAD